MKVNVHRAEINPIIAPEHVKPSRPDMEVIGVFNAGVSKLGDEVILLLRVAERPVPNDPEAYLTPIWRHETGALDILRIERTEDADFSDPRVIRTPYQNYLTSISHLRVARSLDGYNFRIDEQPTVLPETEYETFGIEDPRITELEDGYYITYSAISPSGIVVPLLHTRDFVSFERRGILFHPDNKDVTLFPERIGGRYYALHRPSSSHYAKPDIWIADSDDLLRWGNHRRILGVREGGWDGGRIGASAVPFRTERGWLELYHGADEDNRYAVGAVLLDAERPWQVLARSSRPIMEPEAAFERDGFFANVVFPCGALVEGDTIRLYYGAADRSVGYAEISLRQVLASLEGEEA